MRVVLTMLTSALHLSVVSTADMAADVAVARELVLM